MESVCSTGFRFCTKTSTTSTQQKLFNYNMQIKRNNDKIQHLTSKIPSTCCFDKPFRAQHECQELYLKISDLCDENRKINVLKRDIFFEHGLTWDEEYHM